MATHDQPQRGYVWLVVAPHADDAETQMGVPTGPTQRASAAKVPSRMPLTRAGGAQTARGDLLSVLFAAFGAVEVLRRWRRPTPP